MELTRRDLFKFGGVAAMGAAGAGMLAGCAPSSAGKNGPAEGDASSDGLPSFFQQPEAITDIAETKEFDIVVVGAGAAGQGRSCSEGKQGYLPGQHLRLFACRPD